MAVDARRLDHPRVGPSARTHTAVLWKKQSRIHRYGQAVYRGERTVPAGVGTVSVAEDHVRGSPSFFYGSRPVCGVHSRCNAERPGNAAPVLLGSNQDALLHDGAALPNPVYEALAGQDACTPHRRA